MSVASISGGHVEGAHAMHLRIPQPNSEQNPCFTSVILQSSRAQLIVLALFWELDSSRGASSRPSMPPPASGSTCISVWWRWTGGALILRRVCGRTIQTSANAPRSRWGSPYGPLQLGTRRRNAQLSELDAITSSQMLLHLLV